MGGKLIDRKIRTKVMFHFFFPVQQKILRLLEEFCEFGKKGKNVPLIKWSEDQNNPKIGTRSLNSNYMWTKICVFYVPVLQTKTNNYWCQKFFKNAQKTKCMMWAMTNLQIGVIIDPFSTKKIRQHSHSNGKSRDLRKRRCCLPFYTYASHIIVSIV